MRGNAVVTREFDKEWIQLRQKRARHDGSAWKKYVRLVADWKEDSRGDGIPGLVPKNVNVTSARILLGLDIKTIGKQRGLAIWVRYLVI